MAKKLNRNIATQLKHYASLLPVTYRVVPVIREAQGHQLISKGITSLPNGEAILPNKKYVGQISDQHPIDNFKKIKKIYLEKGIDGVVSYVNQISTLYDKPSAIGGIEVKQG